MRVIAIPTPSLGDTSYLAVSGDGAIIIDPQRDIERFVEAAADEGAEITHVLETHVHNDYVSGGLATARRCGADLVLPAGAGVAFAHIPAFHLEELEGTNGVAIRPIHTPGHTPEHIAYLLLWNGEPWTLFSGGSLLVGSAGRTDLLGNHLAEQLARLQFTSLHRLAELPDDVGVFPTHGEGSFCVSGPAGAAPSSTIGTERRTNPLLAIDTDEEFVASQLSNLLPFPLYYRRMAPINREGPPPMPTVDPPSLSASEFEDVAQGATVVDARSRLGFAAAHVPGALGVELSESFVPWVGWLAPFDRPLLLVLDEGQDASLVATYLARIGFDTIVGVMWGMDEWVHSGRPTAGFDALDAEEGLAAFRAGAQLLDVRDPSEWAMGHVDGAIHSYVPELRDGLPLDLDREVEVVVACATGFRAGIAAGLLERAGLEPRVVLTGGVPTMLVLDR